MQLPALLALAVLATSAATTIDWTKVPSSNDQRGNAPPGCTCISGDASYVVTECCARKFKNALPLFPVGVIVPPALAKRRRCSRIPIEYMIMRFPTRRSCSKFDCGCVCDLTADECDTNCCCDSSCAADVVAAAKTAGACLPNGPAPSTLEYCADVDTFLTINPHDGYATHGFAFACIVSRGNCPPHACSRAGLSTVHMQSYCTCA